MLRSKSQCISVPVALILTIPFIICVLCITQLYGSILKYMTWFLVKLKNGNIIGKITYLKDI